MKYSINLVRHLRAEEQRAMALKNRLFVIAVTAAGILGLAVCFMVFQILGMETKLTNEKMELARIEMEYSKYKSAKMVIDKADIERLDSLQSNRIFWTKKLAAMAFYLPDNYWITKFSFDGKQYRVGGFGYISQKQEQLITLDDYLNKLRADSTYADIFKTTFFNSVSRSDEKAKGERVSFEYSSFL
jgi:Tfp pilus assembly protein PilN